MKNKGNFVLYTIFAIIVVFFFNGLLNSLLCKEIIYARGIPFDGLKKNIILIVSIIFTLFWIFYLIDFSIQKGFFNNYKNFLKKFIVSPFLYVWILSILLSIEILSASSGFKLFIKIILVITELIFIHTNYTNNKNDT